MAWVAQLGSTLLVPTGSASHLHIICSDPMSFQGRAPNSCLMVNLSSVVPKCDQTLLLEVGDHPFIKHSSFVFFAKASIEAASHLESCVNSGLYVEQEQASRPLVKRIVACMDASDFTPGEYRKASTQVWNQTIW